MFQLSSKAHNSLFCWKYKWNYCLRFTVVYDVAIIFVFPLLVFPLFFFFVQSYIVILFFLYIGSGRGKSMEGCHESVTKDFKTFICYFFDFMLIHYLLIRSAFVFFDFACWFNTNWFLIWLSSLLVHLLSIILFVGSFSLHLTSIVLCAIFSTLAFLKSWEYHVLRPKLLGSGNMWKWNLCSDLRGETLFNQTSFFSSKVHIRPQPWVLLSQKCLGIMLGEEPM